MSPKNAIENAEKSLIRARLLRDRALKSIKEIYNFATQAQDNPEQLALLSSRMSLLQKTIDIFNAKQSDIIDALVDLKRGHDFEKDDSPLTDQMELMYFEISNLAQQISPGSTSIVKQEIVHSGQTLPKIELPKFDGVIVNWRSFRDTFMSLVHDNKNIGDIERFHYLLSCLSGPALSVVKALPLTATNYNIAWEALTNRYENQRLLATAHVDQLFAFKPISSESLTSLTAFVNIFNENIAALKVLGVKDLAGFLLFYIGSRVLDSNTRQLFENNAPPNQVPDFSSLMSFVQQRCKILENFKCSEHARGSAKFNKSFTRIPKSVFTTTTTNSHRKVCPFCEDISHPLYRCTAFKKLPVDKRKEIVSIKKLCFSCLSPSHSVNACMSKITCFTCGKRHHSLLHRKQENSSTSTTLSHNDDQHLQTLDDQPKFVGLSRSTTTVVLGTVIVHVLDRYGSLQSVRALVDSGSQISVMTSECVSRLNLPRRKCNTEIVGLSQSPVTKVKGKTNITFTPHHSPYPTISSDNVIIIPHISGRMPNDCLPSSVLKHYQHLQLADPNFDSPAQIDMLIGGDLFPQIIQSRGETIHHPGYPSAVETLLGWVIIGSLDMPCSAPLASLTLNSTPPIDDLIRQFSTIEECDTPTFNTTENKLCEEWFKQTTPRNSNGKFCVALPFRSDVFTLQSDSYPKVNKEAEASVLSTSSHFSKSRDLSDSYSIALKRLFNLEHRLNKDPNLYTAYREFMEEYLSLGHMKRASQPGRYYIPHHPVIKQDGDISKIRVVFDASASTSSGVSLNDVLCVGPKLQTEIFDIILKSRLKKFMFTADIVKMYRPILVRSEDCQYQHILWRKAPSEEVLDYELLTITYGVINVYFLACKTKLTPLKSGKIDASLYIPHLELCAALLLAQLLQRLRKNLSKEILISKVRAWTDSTIVLSWLKANPKCFKFLVTNRVVAIHNILPVCEWNYVPTSENPADPSSRGLLPKAMIKYFFHWNGPSFLRCPDNEWPISSFKVIDPQELPDAKPFNQNVFIVNQIPAVDEILLRFSSLTIMLQSIAYATRFGHRSMKRTTLNGPLTHTEVQYVLFTAIKLTQLTYFSSLFKQLNNPTSVITPVALAQLAPFIDEQGIIRVGGRLRFSSLSIDARCPILLPKKSHLTRQSNQTFWKRCTTEYLSTLQGRLKSYKSTPNIEVENLVIIDAPHRPPTDWYMGRVIAVHPGRDQIVRVATVKTKDSVFKRPVTKLVKLPVE